MIKEYRVTFEIAKLLRDKGFPQNTFEIDCNVCYKYNGKLCNNAKSMSGVDRKISYMAPTIQMVLKWLREVHNIFISPRIQNDGTYICYLYDTKGNGIQGYDKNLVKTTYEESIKAIIKDILEHLI